MNNNVFFVLVASCKVVRGAKRSLIIDYERGELFFISHEYHDLIEKMDRQQIDIVENEIDNESKKYFDEFLVFLKENEIGHFTDEIERFPLLSKTINDEYILLKDVILEIDAALFDKEKFQKLCHDLTSLRCQDFELRIFSNLCFEFLSEIIEILNDTDANCVEIHVKYNSEITMNDFHDFLEKSTIVSRIFVYSAPTAKIVSIKNETEHFPVPLGEIFFINYDFDQGNCCGIINEDSLNFTSFYMHHLHEKKNGCLDRKMSIDRYGNIKNCPSLRNTYGNIDTVSIKTVLENKKFRTFWDINKDQITICSVCEFRYNCTDCRAFLQDSDNLYSKPLKCGYDPYTCTWTEST